MAADRLEHQAIHSIDHLRAVLPAASAIIRPADTGIRFERI
jgi:hypothetical protein